MPAMPCVRPSTVGCFPGSYDVSTTVFGCAATSQPRPRPWASWTSTASRFSRYKSALFIFGKKIHKIKNDLAIKCKNSGFAMLTWRHFVIVKKNPVQ